MGIMLPLIQSLGTIPFSSIKLNKFVDIGRNMHLVVIIYSFKTSSIPQDFLSFHNLIAASISFSPIGSISMLLDVSFVSGVGISIRTSGVYTF